MTLPPHEAALGTQPLFDNAQRLHAAGDLRQAEYLYREILRRDPSHAAAVGALGVIACQSGNLTAGIQLLREAVNHTPGDADLNNNLGMALMSTGDAAAARPLFERALAARARFPEAHFNCGNACLAEGQNAVAEKHYRAALRQRADYVDAANNLGNLLFEAGRMDEAAQFLHKVTQLAPRFAPGQLGLARALAGAGRVEQAIAACRRALALDDTPWSAWELLALCQRRAGDLEGAAEALARAASLAPDGAGLRDQLGLVQFSLGQVEEAAASFQAAENLAPDNPQHANHVGMALGARGEADAARRAFGRALALAPGHAEALRNLAEMVGDDDEAEDLERRIDAALVSQAAPGARSQLLFAQGRLRDRRGDYGAAFASFSAANALRRQEVPFDRAGQRDFINAVIETFSEDFMRRAANLADPSERPVFILGMPRAGTTLVEQIVASHSDVHGAGELVFFPAQVPALVRRDGHGSGYPRGLARRLAEMGQLAPRYLALLAARDPRALRVTDKMPYNFLYLGVIAALFPHARVIHCRREPLATCHSIFTRDLAGSHPYSYDLDSLAEAYVGYRRLMDHWRERLAVSMLDLDYEALLDDQEGQSRRLIEFLGLPWQDACLRFHQSRRAVTTASQWQVRRPLYGEAREHWRHYAEALAPLTLALTTAGVLGGVDERA
ncbi:MAG: sulfotransferase [Proteobacteria bacterium]|nr:sulfotransferase [Pseudomonadota bacterium]